MTTPVGPVRHGDHMNPLDRALLIRDAFRYLDRNGFADGTDYIETTALEFEAALNAEADA